MLKIKGTEIRQQLDNLTRAALGRYAHPIRTTAQATDTELDPIGPAYAVPATTQYFNNRKLSIYGGSNEIQKNIISKLILEL